MGWKLDLSLELGSGLDLSSELAQDLAHKTVGYKRRLGECIFRSFDYSKFLLFYILTFHRGEDWVQQEDTDSFVDPIFARDYM
jgi:hypothetical protein